MQIAWPRLLYPEQLFQMIHAIGVTHRVDLGSLGDGLVFSGDLHRLAFLDDRQIFGA